MKACKSVKTTSSITKRMWQYQLTTCLFLFHVEILCLAWDNGKEGNYWSNYTGVDANLDGIGDTPYVVRSDYVYTIDMYPLVSPFDIPEPSITSNATVGLPSLDNSAAPSSNDSSNGSGLPENTHAPSFASAVEKNTQLQVILVIIAALAAYLAVVVSIATFRNKKGNNPNTNR